MCALQQTGSNRGNAVSQAATRGRCFRGMALVQPWLAGSGICQPQEQSVPVMESDTQEA